MNRGEVRQMVRDLINEPSPAFWSDPLLNRFINRAYEEVYTEFTQTNEAYFATSGDISFTANTQLYNLPNAGAIMRILFVERRDLEVPITMRPIALVEKNKWESTQIVASTDAVFRYLLLGSQIAFVPTPRSTIANAARVYYVPNPTLPTTIDNAQDSFTFPAEMADVHTELIVWLTMLRAIAKDRELVTAHMPHVSRLWDLCKADVNRRQFQEPMQFILSEDEIY